MSAKRLGRLSYVPGPSLAEATKSKTNLIKELTRLFLLMNPWRLPNVHSMNKRIILLSVQDGEVVGRSARQFFVAGALNMSQVI